MMFTIRSLAAPLFLLASMLATAAAQTQTYYGYQTSVDTTPYANMYMAINAMVEACPGTGSFPQAATDCKDAIQNTIWNSNSLTVNGTTYTLAASVEAVANLLTPGTDGNNPGSAEYFNETLTNCAMDSGKFQGNKAFSSASPDNFPNVANVCPFMTTNAVWPPHAQSPDSGKYNSSIFEKTFATRTVDLSNDIGNCGTADCIKNRVFLLSVEWATYFSYYSKVLAYRAAFQCSALGQGGPVKDARESLDNAAALASGCTADSGCVSTSTLGVPSYGAYYNSTTETVGDYNAPAQPSVANFITDSCREFECKTSNPSFGQLFFNNFLSMKGSIDDNLCSLFVGEATDKISAAAALRFSVEKMGSFDNAAKTRYFISTSQYENGDVAAGTTDRNNLAEAAELLGYHLQLPMASAGPYLSLVLGFNNKNYLTDTSQIVSSAATKTKILTPLMAGLQAMTVYDCDKDITTYTGGSTDQNCTQLGYIPNSGTIDPIPSYRGYDNSDNTFGTEFSSATNVNMHSYMDMDMREMKTGLKKYDFYNSLYIFQYGKFSQKSTNLRSMQGMSIGTSKNGVNPFFDADAKFFEEYSLTPLSNGANTAAKPNWFGDTLALNGFPVDGVVSGTFNEATSAKARYETNVKIPVFLTLNEYVQSEMFDQLDDCRRGAAKENPNSRGKVTAVDEAAVFGIGSYGNKLYQGTYADVTQAEVGSGQYQNLWCAFANKYYGRFENMSENPCDQFVTNIALIQQQGINDQASGSVTDQKTCGGQTVTDGWPNILYSVEASMMTPYTQGVIFYSEKISNILGQATKTDDDLDDLQEYLAEANAFLSVINPKIAQCNYFDAQELGNALQFSPDLTTIEANFPSSYTTIWKIIIDNLPCLGLTCAKLGNYPTGVGAGGFNDWCTQNVATNVPKTNTTNLIAQQYTAGKADILNRGKVNLDIQEINNNMFDGNFTEAQTIYTSGKNSPKATSLRKLQSMATKEPNFAAPEFLMSTSVLGQSWANAYVESLITYCSNQAVVGNITDPNECPEIVSRALVSTVVIPYTSYEYSDCENDCFVDKPEQNQGQVKACDEGVSFWAGEDQMIYQYGEVAFSAYSFQEMGPNLVTSFFYDNSSNIDSPLTNPANQDPEFIVPNTFYNDATIGKGESSTNLNFMKTAYSAQQNVETSNCLFDNSTSITKPKGLNDDVKSLQGTIFVEQIQSMYRFMYAIVKADHVTSYDLKLAQTPALSVLAKLQFCAPQAALFLNNQLFDAASVKSITSNTDFPMLPQNAMCGKKEQGVFSANCTMAIKMNNLLEMRNYIQANYLCMGINTCQSIGELQVPAGVPTAEPQNTNLKNGIPLMDTIIPFCHSMPSPKCDVIAGSTSYFNGTNTMGPCDPPPELPNINYQFSTNVFPHMQTDKDQSFIGAYVGGKLSGDVKFQAAQYIYERGYNSYKTQCNIPGAGSPCQTSMRTIKKFAPGYKTDGSMDFAINNNNIAFWGPDGPGGLSAANAPYWPNWMTESALTNTDISIYQVANYSISEDGRAEIVKKATANGLVWVYAIREIKAALQDCQAGSKPKAFKHWDEAAAFMTGSQMYDTDYEGFNTGQLIYGLAAKRAPTFANVIAPARSIITSLLNAKQNLIDNLQCSAIEDVLDGIGSAGLVPQIQAVITYVWKTDNVATLKANRRSEEQAELYAFAGNVMPQVYACNSTAGELMYDNLNIFQDEANIMKDGWKAVLGAMESTYDCMKVTCESIGDYTTTPTADNVVCSTTLRFQDYIDAAYEEGLIPPPPSPGSKAQVTLAAGLVASIVAIIVMI